MQEIVLCGRVICPNHVVRTLSPLAELGYRGVFAVPYGEDGEPDDCARAIEALGSRVERVKDDWGNAKQKDAALAILKMQFPEAWVLFIDVGETWQGGTLPELDQAAEAYKVEVGPDTAVRPELRLAKVSACSQFVGYAAEYLNLKGKLVTGELPGAYGIGLAVPSQAELERSVLCLKAERRRDPHTQRWAFWLGEFERALGEPERAMEQYDNCVHGSRDEHGVFLPADGWIQERYVALLRWASLLPAVSRPRRLLEAIQMLPERAEAYIDLAEAYRLQGSNALAYGMGHAAVQVARQPQEGWMLDRTVQSRADDVLAMSASGLNLFDEALFHGSMALVAQPSSERMATNLAYYRRAGTKDLGNSESSPAAIP